jgi:hypothetical protein
VAVARVWTVRVDRIAAMQAFRDERATRQAIRAPDYHPPPPSKPFQEIPDEFNARVDAFWRGSNARARHAPTTSNERSRWPTRPQPTSARVGAG